MTTAPSQYRVMDRETLKAKIDRKDRFHLWNVLGQDNYRAEVNIEGSRWMAVYNITESAVAAVVASKGETIVVYCGSRTSPASKLAARKLTEMGYTNVFAFEGGLMDWTNGGFPTVTI